MIGSWIRFGISALLMTAGMLTVYISILGIYRFRFVLNRMHPASLTDTLALMLVVAALIVAMGVRLATVKLVLMVIFMWMASPISSHLLCKLELLTDEELAQHARIEDPRSLEAKEERK